MFKNKNILKAFQNFVNIMYPGVTFGEYNMAVKEAVANYSKVVKEELGFEEEYLKPYIF